MEESFDPSLLCLSYYASLNGASLNVFRHEWWQLFDIALGGAFCGGFREVNVMSFLLAPRPSVVTRLP